MVRWGEKIEDGFDYPKITQTSIKKKVFVVAICNGASGKLSIELHENKLSNENLAFENPIKFLIGENVLKGPNVVTEKTGSKVKGNNGIQDIIAIILHRTACSTIAGAIAHTKGTHFYVEGGRGVDGEIFQPIKLNQYSNHIMNSTARTARLEIQTENSIGIEVVGMAYYKKGDDLYTIYDTKVNDPNSVNLTKGYAGQHKIDGKWTDTQIYWDQLTEAQTKSVKCLVIALMEKYNLKKTDIFIHEEIQSKTGGEGGSVKDAIFHLLDECL